MHYIAMNLYNETVKLLNEQKTVTRVVIAEHSGVSLRWLSYLSSGTNPDFSVTKVQRVYDFLISMKEQEMNEVPSEKIKLSKKISKDVKAFKKPGNKIKKYDSSNNLIKSKGA